MQLAYNGKNYNGWQIQKNTPNTIQGVLIEKIKFLLADVDDVVGCGRTDTGVHAKDYFAHFVTQHKIDNKEHFIYKLNKLLPFDIAVSNVYKVIDDANARFSADFRSYQYFIARSKNPFLTETSYYVWGDLNLGLMNKAAELLLNNKDFTSFSKLHTQVNNNNCNVTEAFWKEEEGCFVFNITANRFLRNMVRAIVGTLLEVGKGKITLEQFQKIIDSKNRNNAGFSVPAQALFLTNIIYPKSIFINE